MEDSRFGHVLDTDVLVIGAGPTGLALATTLARAGIHHVIVDRLSTGQNTSRAAVIHAHTLEVLESLGVTDTLIREGLNLTKFTIRDRDQVLLTLHFDALPSKYAGLLMLPQDRTEAILGQALANATSRVRWGLTVQSLTETRSAVEATVVSEEGSQVIRARYVVGADGMNSIVRKTAGIAFTGGSYEESFVLADVDMNWENGREEVTQFFSPDGLVVVAPLPNGTYRMVATLEDAPSQPGIADMQALLDTRGPTHRSGQILNVRWSTRFRLHHRVADNYRRGRLFLVGDAAHVHSPAGGQGMNTGLVDACVLGRLLTDVVSGKCGETHLNKYEALRRPAAKQVLHLAGRLTHLATMKSTPKRFMRNMLFRMVNRLPSARHHLALDLSGLSRCAAAIVDDERPSSSWEKSYKRVVSKHAQG